MAELYRAWSVNDTDQPFFIEKSSSIDNRTATINNTQSVDNV